MIVSTNHFVLCTLSGTEIHICLNYFRHFGSIASSFCVADSSCSDRIFALSSLYSFHTTTVMALKLLINASLLVIPIGGSLGALFGIDAHRSATGQPPLFTHDGDGDGTGIGNGNGNGGSTGGGSTGGGSGDNGHTVNNGVTNSMYCQNSYGISPPSDGQLYTCEFLSA